LFSQLIKKSDFLTQIKFWRDKNGREVDFVVEKEGVINAYEVKYKKEIKKKDLSYLFYFKNLYKNAKIYLFNITKPKTEFKEVKFISYFEV
jgi:predicted AAA+ superfamily ATPase